jgi:hypothetical protein
MANLFGQNVGTNYVGILNLGNGLNTPVSTTLEPITDGDGITSSLSISDTKVAVNSEIYIGNDRSGTWEPGIYNTNENNINISINPATIVVSNQYSSGSYNPTKTPGAIFEVASTTQGMLLPRMNSSERNAIFVQADPAPGLVVYDTDLKQICYYDNTSLSGSWFGLTATPV